MSELEHDIAGSETSPAAQTLSVGSQLRAAREAAQLTPDDVAQALKFSPRQIAALEADDYAALPGATIVRGFVRNYARLLKLDATKLLQQLDDALPSGPVEVRPPDNMGIASERRGLRESSPLLTLSLVLLLAAALLMLWHFFGPVPQRAAPAAAGAESSIGQTTNQPPASPAPTPVTASADTPVTASADSPVPAPADVATGQGSSPALHFSFADRSWVEVVDANKQVLHSGENPPGSELNLVGQPPFDIVIGNATKVTLSYDGKPIDLAPHTRAEVARLRLE
ncbi:helix-turn-helix domain-containing protein [Sulfuricystis multivorans]|uniref:helix-turn-helix domain-containing protein n=1 Tax=Sulfuricystis multivorans TaxID=2211108 RepID=UPI000F8268D8|nr:RodZ domain-containing protein [Sulfuricystis multivorans]